MAFHKSNLGMFGSNLPSDLDGYVPELGDTPDGFNWDAQVEWDAQLWADYVDDAVEQTDVAESELARWRAA